MRTVSPPRTSYIATMLFLVAAFVLTSAGAQAQTALLDEVHTIAASDQGVPIEHAFTVSAAGAGSTTYQVVLTDLGAPSAPLASLKLAITSGGTIVGTPLAAAGTTQFTATSAGSYVVRIVGAPGPATGSGPFGVVITKVADGSQLVSFSDSLARPVSAATNVAVLDDSFTVTTAANYQVTLSDLLFPQNLNTATLALTAQGGNSLLANLAVTTTTPVSTATAALAPGTTYRIFAIGQATTTANAGLYSAVVRDPAGTVIYSRTLAVGAVTALGAASLVAGTYTLNYTDLAYPAALSASGTSGAFIALDDQVAARLTGTGSKSFTASNGSYQTFALGTPASTGAGSYAVEVRPANGTAVLSVAQPVTLSTSLMHAYTFSATIATAGSYNAQFADFQVPMALTSVNFAAVQGATLLGNPLTTAGTLAITAAAGNVSLLVFAQAPTAGSLFGVSVTPAAGGSPLLQTTQGVGALFTTQKVTVPTAGLYGVNVSDLGFPGNFASLYAVVTQGSTVVGSISTGGLLPFTATAASDYFVTFAAQPSGTDKAGTFAISVTPAPTATLTADVSRVASGGSVNLTWSSTNATSCTASGGGSWTGSQATSGTVNTGVLTSDTTFTLSCAGPGGTTKASAAVTIIPPASTGGGGGGGSLDLYLLLALVGVLALRPLNRP